MGCVATHVHCRFQGMPPLVALGRRQHLPHPPTTNQVRRLPCSSSHSPLPRRKIGDYGDDSTGTVRNLERTRGACAEGNAQRVEHYALGRDLGSFLPRLELLAERREELKGDVDPHRPQQSLKIRENLVVRRGSKSCKGGGESRKGDAREEGGGFLALYPRRGDAMCTRDVGVHAHVFCPVESAAKSFRRHALHEISHPATKASAA